MNNIAPNAKPESDRQRDDARRYAGILTSSNIPFWQRDAVLSITYCNAAFSELTEEVLDDALDMTQMELFKGQREMARAALESGLPQRQDHHVVVAGQRRLLRVYEVPSTLEKLVTGYAIDITEQEEIREEVGRYITAQQDFLESSTNAMAIFGRDMRIQSFNFAYVRLWKLEESWLDSKPTYADILEHLRENRRLPEQANFRAFKQQHLKLFTDLIDPSEEFFYLPDGKILRVVIIPHALGGLFFAYEDVTDRLALERSYNTLIAVQRETLDNLHEAVVVVGEDGRLKLSNPIFFSLWGLDARVLQSEPHVRDVFDLCKHYFSMAEWAPYRDQFIAQILQRKAQSGRFERVGGTVLDWRMVPLPDGGTLLTFTDVTNTMLVERSLREKNEALEAADHLKTEFLANVSYELRSPLTSISGFSDILRNEYFGQLNEKQREYIEGIHQSSQHLGQLINNILDLASIEAGYMQLDISEFDVYDMLDSVLLLLRERLRVLDLAIEKQCDPEIGAILGDETRIRQVMFNLLSNAVKYSRPGGLIQVGAAPLNENEITIWVKDHGVGIDPEKQARVFEKFYRAGASAGQQSGSGLGLSMVKSFIELHGGSVSLTSTPGVGTTFTCIIPRKPITTEKI